MKKYMPYIPTIVHSIMFLVTWSIWCIYDGFDSLRGVFLSLPVFVLSGLLYQLFLCGISVLELSNTVLGRTYMKSKCAIPITSVYESLVLHLMGYLLVPVLCNYSAKDIALYTAAVFLLLREIISRTIAKLLLANNKGDTLLFEVVYIISALVTLIIPIRILSVAERIFVLLVHSILAVVLLLLFMIMIWLKCGRKISLNGFERKSKIRIAMSLAKLLVVLHLCGSLAQNTTSQLSWSVTLICVVLQLGILEALINTAPASILKCNSVLDRLSLYSNSVHTVVTASFPPLMVLLFYSIVVDKHIAAIASIQFLCAFVVELSMCLNIPMYYRLLSTDRKVYAAVCVLLSSTCSVVIAVVIPSDYAILLSMLCASVLLMLTMYPVYCMSYSKVIQARNKFL